MPEQKQISLIIKKNSLKIMLSKLYDALLVPKQLGLYSDWHVYTRFTEEREKTRPEYLFVALSQFIQCFSFHSIFFSFYTSTANRHSNVTELPKFEPIWVENWRRQRQKRFFWISTSALRHENSYISFCVYPGSLIQSCLAVNGD